ncbi:MAG: hypothetical protein KIT25_22150 [Enhydrobacter sp.]|nr:MAG: hypothetical protein KIT25_22150 [Enhydrobacter sp.]
MSRLFPRLLLVAGIGMVGAACQDDGHAAPRGYYQPAPVGYTYGPAPAYGYSPPAPYSYANPRANYGWYNQPAGRGYTMVTVTNRGQHGNRDDVVQQRVACGSQYFDGYNQRIARC